MSNFKLPIQLIVDKNYQHLCNEAERFLKIVRSGGLAVKHPALGVNDHKFEPLKRSKLFQRLISQLTTRLNGAAFSTELFKIKGDVKKNPDDVKHSGSHHPQCISALYFRTAPL